MANFIMLLVLEQRFFMDTIKTKIDSVSPFKKKYIGFLS